jgi:hypothetical protein
MKRKKMRKRIGLLMMRETFLTIKMKKKKKKMKKTDG